MILRPLQILLSVRWLLLLLAGVMAVPTSAFAQRMYNRYEGTDITVRDRTANERDIPIILRDINQESIIYSPMNYQQGTAELPLSNEELRLFYEYPTDQWNNVLRAMRLGNYTEAVELLRPMAYPLVKFLVVPEERFNGHEMVVRLYESLVKADFLDEALYLADKLPLEGLNEDFMSLTIDLANALVEDGDTIKSIRAIQLIPLTAERAPFIPMLLDFAGSLRTRGEYEAALILYGRLRGFPDPEVQQTANLWTAYINILIEQYDTVQSFLDLVGEIDKEERTFSLLRLIQGRLLLAREDKVNAINTIAEGVVASDVSYPWAPDLLFASALCYEQMNEHEAIEDNKLVAANIYHQLRIFFPTSSWAEKAEVRMASLPVPAEVEAALPDEELKALQRQRGGSEAITGGDEGWGDVIE